MAYTSKMVKDCNLLNSQAQRIENERNPVEEDVWGSFMMTENNLLFMSGFVSTSLLWGLKPRQPQQHNQTHVSFTEVRLYLTSKREMSCVYLSCKIYIL